MALRPIGPWRATQTAKQPHAPRPDEAGRIVNLYARDPESGPVLVGVPGFTLMGAQLGSGGNRTVQRVVQFTKRNGTEYTVAIVGGQFYAYNWGANAWTEVLDSSDFSGAGITLSVSAKVYAVTFADQLVVSDGTNTPWAWDGTTHGGLTKLTNAPVCYGPLVVYYGKLFAIKNTARQTIVWSEEGDPTTGYEAGGYNNAWDLVQTETEGLVALAATNDALYYLRENSTGAITGAVTTDFQTTGTREAVSSSFGTTSPASVTVIENAVWHVDQYGALRRALLGRSDEVGLGSRELLRGISPSSLATWVGAHDAEAGHWLVGCADTGSALNTVLRLDERDGRYAGCEQGYRFTTLDVVKNADRVPTLVHGGGSDAMQDAEGYCYAHGQPDGSTWNRGFADGAVAITHEVESGPGAWHPLAASVFTRFDLTLQPRTTWSGARLTLTTPYRTRTLDLPTVAQDGTPLGEFVLGTDTLGGSFEERRAGYPLRERGRWCRFLVAHSTLGERMEVNLMAVDATPISTKTGVR